MPHDGWQRLALAFDALQQPALDLRSVGPRPAQDAPRDRDRSAAHREACAFYDQYLWQCTRDGNCNQTVLDALKRRCSETALDAGWSEQAHPRGQPKNAGEFAKGGGGSAPATQAPAAPEIPDEVKQNKQFAPFFERGALEPRTRTNSYGKQELEFHPHPSPNIQAFHAGREDQPDKVAYYDPRYADLETLNAEEPIIARKIAVPKEGVETEFHPPADENAIYRGISAEEYAAIQQTGEVRSKGEFNIGPEQEGLTYWTKDPSMANSYANSFAPAAMKPTPDRPAYIVATQMPQETKRVQGTGAAEVGVARPIKREEITGIWRGDPIEYTPGNYSMPDQFGSGVSGVSPSATLRWSRIDQQAHDMALDIRAVGPRRLGQDKFDPSEPRDPTGEWTTGGGSGKAAASPKSKPEEPSPGPAATKAKPPSGSKRGDKARDAHQARVNQILAEGYANKFPSPPEQKKMVHDIVGVAYDYMGVDQKDVPFTFEPSHEFKVGDRNFRSGGMYYRGTRRITIADDQSPAASGVGIGGLASHEVMHAKYDAVQTAYREEDKRLSKDKRGGHAWVMHPDGRIREEYQADYPVHTAMPNGFGGSFTNLKADDGITDYSREWWKAANEGKAQPESAVNETLAEMAALDWQGVLPRLTWFKQSKSYKPFYEAIHKVYPMVAKGRKAEPEEMS